MSNQNIIMLIILIMIMKQNLEIIQSINGKYIYLKNLMGIWFEKMISFDECKLFYEGIKYEYGYGIEKNIEKALSIYIKSSSANSQKYLSMTRLFDIYRSETDKFQIKKDKNLELIYLFKSFAYLPISILNERVCKDRFPFDLAYTIASFLDNNDPNIENLSSYFNDLIKIKKYKNIISEEDIILINSFIEGYFDYSMNKNKTSLDTLIALSLGGNNEASYKLIFIYLEILKEFKDDQDKSKELEKEELLTKIYDLFSN